MRKTEIFSMPLHIPPSKFNSQLKPTKAYDK